MWMLVRNWVKMQYQSISNRMMCHWKNTFYFYLALPADSTNGTKIALSSAVGRTASIKDSSGTTSLSKSISTPKDKISKEAISQSTNISFISAETGGCFSVSKPLDTSANSGNDLTSNLPNPSLTSNQPLNLPRPQISASTVDQPFQQDAYRRRSSNNSNTSSDMPKLSMIGHYGHPARLGGPPGMRSTGPMHWHGFSGSRMWQDASSSTPTKIDAKRGAAPDAKPMLPAIADSKPLENLSQDKQGQPLVDGNSEPINPFIPSAGDEEYPILAVWGS